MSGSTVLGFIVAVLIIGAVADIDNALIGLVAGSALVIHLFGWWGVLGVAMLVLPAWAASRTPAPPQKSQSSRKTDPPEQKTKSSRETDWIYMLPYSDDGSDD